MGLIHNIILRELNCITVQAPNVKEPENILYFMAFCGAWTCVLKSHHNAEETVYFPLLEEQSTSKGVLAKNHAEHETFLLDFWLSMNTLARPKPMSNPMMAVSLPKSFRASDQPWGLTCRMKLSC